MGIAPSRPKTNKKIAFNAQLFLDSAGVARKVVDFQIKATIFAQGDPAKTVMYIQKGRVSFPWSMRPARKLSWQLWYQVVSLVRGA